MDLESVKKLLEGTSSSSSSIDGLPVKFFDPFIVQGMEIDLIEPGRLICSMKVPCRLLNTGNFLHGGATLSLVDLIGSAAIYTASAVATGVSVEINVSYLDSAFLDVPWDVHSKTMKVTTEGDSSAQRSHSATLISRVILSTPSTLWEEIEIEANVLRVGKAIGVVNVELRKKKTGKIFALGRHTKYLPVASKL